MPLDSIKTFKKDPPAAWISVFAELWLKRFTTGSEGNQGRGVELPVRTAFATTTRLPTPQISSPSMRNVMMMSQCVKTGTACPQNTPHAPAAKGSAPRTTNAVFQKRRFLAAKSCSSSSPFLHPRSTLTWSLLLSALRVVATVTACSTVLPECSSNPLESSFGAKKGVSGGSARSGKKWSSLIQRVINAQKL